MTAFDISVIIPSIGREGTLERCLESLNAQTMALPRFEVIVVLNGEGCSQQHRLVDFQHQHPNLQLRWFTLNKPSPGAARNLGIELALGAYITFIDDDDYVLPAYLQALFAVARPEVIGAVSLVEETAKGKRLPLSGRAKQIQANLGKAFAIGDAGQILSFIACKLIPAPTLRYLRFDEDLHSGEDVVFFAQLLRFPNLCVSVSTDTSAAYVRTITENSVSRPSNSACFRQDRQKCVAALERLCFTVDKSLLWVILGLIRAQRNLM